MTADDLFREVVTRHYPDCDGADRFVAILQEFFDAGRAYERGLRADACNEKGAKVETGDGREAVPACAGAASPTLFETTAGRKDER